jgi:hypothetical protein
VEIAEDKTIMTKCERMNRNSEKAYDGIFTAVALRWYSWKKGIPVHDTFFRADIMGF